MEMQVRWRARGDARSSSSSAPPASDPFAPQIEPCTEQLDALFQESAVPQPAVPQRQRVGAPPPGMVDGEVWG